MKNCSLIDEIKQVKILLLGDSGVGKTSIISRYAKKSFLKSTKNTVGIDFVSSQITIDNQVVKIQIWDTAGQERFKTITKNYYKQCDGIVLVYDVTDRNSFASLRFWLEEIKEHSGNLVQKTLVGNKIDLEDRRCVQNIEGQKLAEEMQISFIEVSAKNDIGIQNLFKEFTTDIIQFQSSYKPHSFSLLDRQPPDQQAQKKSSCCKL